MADNQNDNAQGNPNNNNQINNNQIIITNNISLDFSNPSSLLNATKNLMHQKKYYNQI